MKKRGAGAGTDKLDVSAPATLMEPVIWCSDEMPFVCKKGYADHKFSRNAVAIGFDPYDKIRQLNNKCPCESQHHAQVMKKNNVTFAELSRYV